MISFNLSCDQGHVFEGWFSSSADYDDQQERGFVACPICDSAVVSKALMTPNVTAKSNQQEPQNMQILDDADCDARVMQNTPQTDLLDMMNPPPAQPHPQKKDSIGDVVTEVRQFQKIVETHCDDVGNRFAEEARKIHYGERPPRNIYGQTTDKEVESLIEEDIEVVKIPWLPKEQ